MSLSVISLKYGCFKAYFIEIRRIGSKAINFINRSKETLSKFLKWTEGSTPLNFGNVGLKSGSFSIFKNKITDILPLFWGWSSMELEYFEDLINFRISTKQWFFLDKLSKDASDSPNINT